MASTSERTTKYFIGSVEDEWQLYSNNEEDYTIGAPIGFGASSIVYSATYNPPNAENPVDCALKVLDLDRLPQHALRLLERETQLMSISKHPNVLRVRGSWMAGHKLYIAMRLMKSGSASDVMRYGWPGGMEEDVVRAILKQALEGLNYFHINGLIHRDIKSANLLLDGDGTVLLGDLGVAAFLWDSEDSGIPTSIPDNRRVVSFEPDVAQSSALNDQPTRPRMGKRKSFVGTPCWMAPEVIQGRKYDSKADIWSFGITALELTQGRPPRSREAPQKVLLKTVQNAPPTLDRKGGLYKYSRAFFEIVESCLHKDPAKRPTAEQLLQTPFFRGAKRKNYLVNNVLKGLPPLHQRQERQTRHRSASRHNTVASWDFSLSYQPSGTHNKSLSQLSFSSSEVELDPKGSSDTPRSVAVFEFDEEQVMDDTQESVHLLTDNPEEDIPSSTSTPGPSTPASSTPDSSNDDAPFRGRKPSSLPTTRPIPLSIPQTSRAKIPSPLPALSRTPKSLPSSSENGPMTPPTPNTPPTATFGTSSKLWKKFSRVGGEKDKKKKKGMVGVLDTAGV